MSQLTVLLNPEQRALYLNELLRLDGLEHVKEDPKAAYCPISITQTPDELKLFLKKRQQQLIDVLKTAGIKAWNPIGEKTNPDYNRQDPSIVIYNHDTEKVLGARFFCGHNLVPSTGFGNECEKARIYNRIAILLLDKHIYVSRMRPFRTIYLEYHRFEDNHSEMVKMFKLLQQYDPGIGFNGKIPALLGFHKKTGEVVDLEELVYTRFPKLQYKYNGEVPMIKLRAENPELFYEYEQK